MQYFDLLRGKVRDSAEPNPASAFARGYADKAAHVEKQLREEFGRASLFVLPHIQMNPSMMEMSPCIRVSDSTRPELDYHDVVVERARVLAQSIFGDEDVYVSTEELTVGPEGDGLKYVVDHALSLRFGHSGYNVELDCEAETYPSCIVEIVDYSGSQPSIAIPQMIVDYVMNISRVFRPDITFNLSEEVESIQVPPLAAPGFMSGFN